MVDDARGDGHRDRTLVVVTAERGEGVHPADVSFRKHQDGPLTN
jgi:hypothetical protein